MDGGVQDADADADAAVFAVDALTVGALPHFDVVASDCSVSRGAGWATGSAVGYQKGDQEEQIGANFHRIGSHEVMHLLVAEGQRKERDWKVEDDREHQDGVNDDDLARVAEICRYLAEDMT